MGVLALRELHARHTTEQLVKKIVSTIRLARIDSLKQQKALILTLQARQLKIVSQNTSSATQTTNYQIKFPPNINACETKTMQLWQRGTASVDSLCIKSSQAVCEIIISLRGRVRAECL
jgi:hypothetical protein